MTTKNEYSRDSVSHVFEMLSHEYRRRILMAVAQANPRDEDDITSEVSTNGDEEDALDHLKLALYHNHLPRLDDVGFIDWNRDTGVITRGPQFEEIEPILTLMNDHQDELPDNWP